MVLLPTEIFSMDIKMSTLQKFELGMGNARSGIKGFSTGMGNARSGVIGLVFEAIP
jgi:hypothetical protein